MSERELMESLAAKKLLGTISPQEDRVLSAFFSQAAPESMEWDGAEEELRVRLLSRIRSSAGITAPVYPMRKKILKFTAAACILAVLGLGYWFYDKGGQRSMGSGRLATHDIKAPSNNRARITTASGTIYLDSAANGALVQQRNVTLIKKADGQVTYQSTVNGQPSTVEYNTLENPRGSRVIWMTLSDGSQVWLNAGSSLVYPTVFTGTQRKVTISGEGYFEVSHNPSMPFIVGKGDMNVTVMGTHFNVNAYDDEEDMKVTLLEGSVKVSTGNGQRSAVIKPGEQATATVNHQLSTINADLDAVVGWKSGRFELDNTPLPVIMRQLGRWYDVEVRYEGKPRELKFGGGISRQLPLSGVLKLLEAGGARFEWEGNILKVK